MIVLEMIRPDEFGRRSWRPFDRLDQFGRERCRRAMDQACAEWRSARPGTRLFRLHPSRPLWRILDFSRERAEQGAALGRGDARGFLRTLSESLPR